MWTHQYIQVWSNTVTAIAVTATCSCCHVHTGSRSLQCCWIPEVLLHFSLLETSMYPSMCVHLDTNCRNKTALCNSISSGCKIWLPFKTFYLSTAVTVLNYLGHRTMTIRIIKPLWIQTCRNSLVQCPALGLGVYLKPASNLQVLKVNTWRVLTKFFYKTVFIAFSITPFSSPKARYLSLKSSTYLWYNKKMLFIPHFS